MIVIKNMIQLFSNNLLLPIVFVVINLMHCSVISKDVLKHNHDCRKKNIIQLFCSNLLLPIMFVMHEYNFSI